MTSINPTIESRTTSDLEQEANTLQRRIDEISGEINKRSGDNISERPSKPNLKPFRSHSKSGYLYKWKDRTIGWGGTKWDLRFVRLERGRLCYYRTHDDTSPRYILTLRRCAVRDDGHKPNKRFRKSEPSNSVTLKTPNAFFHLLSVYQRPADDDEEKISPLLRFSTTSAAEKNQWIELISEACAYCDTDEFAQNDNDEFSSIAYAYNHKPTTIKNAHGTIPMMRFDSVSDLCIKTVPSGVAKKKQPYIIKNSSKNASKSNSERKSDYPPSKPMHRRAEPSYLSDEAPIQNYRGFLNLGFIIFFISNIRLLLGTVKEYGFVFAKGIGLQSSISFIGLPFISGMFFLNVFIYQAFLIEVYSSRRILSETASTLLHLCNANLALFVPTGIVWYLIDSPLGGTILLMCAVTTWMKLLSYMHANKDYRDYPNRAALTVIQNLDQDSQDISYPRNVTLSNIYYFCMAPTLTYQIAFPRLSCRKWFRVVTLSGRLIFSISVMFFILTQVISPTLDAMITELEGTDKKYGMFSPDIMAKYLLRLTIASTYTWLLVFYAYFHLFFNLLAEILRFGDCVFYKDWWNSSNVSSYWRLWNMPVHYWLIRHIYFPCIRKGMKKTAAMFTVFFISAVLHELLISIPFHMLRPWSFLGMMGQIPLIAITKYCDKIWPGSSIGNFVFWLSFCIIGQPTAILMYTIDYWKMTSETYSDGVNLDSIRNEL